MNLRHPLYTNLIGKQLALAALLAVGCNNPKTNPNLDPQGADVVLTDVTAAMGLPAATSPCVVFRDFDHDGHPDILLAPVDVNGQSNGSLVLYKNVPGKPFEMHSVTSGLDFVQTCAAADFDNDGWVDIAVVGSKGGIGALALLHSDGSSGLVFTDVTGTASAPVAAADPHVQPNAVGFFDQDRDGFLDLYVGFYGGLGGGFNCAATATDFACHPIMPLQDQAPIVFHNSAGKTFAPTTGASAPSQPLYINAVSFIDWDGDGFVDVMQSVDFGQNQLLRNLSGSGYMDLLPGLGANPYNHGMGSTFADFDRDSRWDAYFVDAGPDQVYFGKADGTVENRAIATGVADATHFHSGWSPLAADFNNDGYVDVFVSNAAVCSSTDELTALFSANPMQTVTSATQGSFVFTNQQGAAFHMSSVPYTKLRPNTVTGVAAYADYDGDGLVDVLEVVQARSLVTRLLHNETAAAGTHWLGVRLSGGSLNRDAAGAVVILNDTAGELGRRAVGMGGCGTSTEVAHFGLGPHATVGSIAIQWPDGMHSTVPGPITADQVLDVKHP